MEEREAKKRIKKKKGELFTVNQLKIFACNSAEDFAQRVCKEIGVELRKKRSV